ncbi:M-phase phosphoprotein 6-like [Ruditapes philippinarum]|uniref:M-phase phosphoprotein 6-like n=1 Tax=Ruditapes philippinarum TaxID=129788 RepID=UPI00295BE215|nr:M-phase phosphoprotein 6-like [Ruditapes philippinarum]
MAGDESKSSLSSNVLQMKFMKRSALRIEKEKSEEERKHEIDDEHWVLDLPPIEQRESKYVLEPSYERCENLMYGRMSFKGFNTEVEKLMVQNNARLQLEDAERRENETSVNDEEMAQRFQSLSDTINKRFLTKRQRQTEPEENSKSSRKKVKKQFIKPADD